MIKHAKQIEVRKDKSRFKYLLCGRRGGKSVGLKEDALEHIPLAPEGSDIFYIGPTNQHAYELMWDAFEDRLYELKWKHKALQSKRRFEFSNGVKFYIIGAEKIQRIRGHKVFRAYLDELAYFEQDLFKVWKSVRPALSDLKGGAVLATTPNGKGTSAYDFYLRIMNQPDWKYFHWRTIDNPFIDPNEIEDAKRELDEKAFKQEYEASWESFEGLAWYNFDENIHIGQCSKLIEGYPIDMLFDFNVNPTTLLLAQRIGTIFIRKEYSLRHSSTIETLKKFCEDFKDKKDYQFRIFGDATGFARESTTGYSDYHFIQEALRAEGFKYQLKVPGHNPPIIDRVMYANSWLKNYYGESRVLIDAGCPALIRDLGSQEVDGRHPSDKNNLGHKADAFSYYTYALQIEERHSKQRTILL